jgi:hypothetical protein
MRMGSTAGRNWSISALVFTILFVAPGLMWAQEGTSKLSVEWEKPVIVSKTTPTLQVVVNPMLMRSSPIHDQAFLALKNMKADYVRFVPWLPYPRLGVAELREPANGKTWWDFSLIDPITRDFFDATEGHSTVLNFSTIPEWMFKGESAGSIPEDPKAVVWDYEKGAELRDASGKEVADYYGRLVSWYTRGGFTDELDVEHHSGHSYALPYWEVLNEPDYEHNLSAAQYTAIYDAVVSTIHKLSPGTKFVGISLATPGKNPQFFEYFLNPQNHRTGIPLDLISYHFYAVPEADENPETQEHTFFAQADGFLNVVRYIESTRLRLSPQTKTMINEIGSISAEGANQGAPGEETKPIPDSYWNLSGALFAYLFGELTRMGIDVVGESQLVGYPTQFPSVTMADWSSGQPNARYWVLKLLRENFGAGDTVVESKMDLPYVYSMAVLRKDGRRRVLLVNKRSRPVVVTVPNAQGGAEEFVDLSTASQAASSVTLKSDKVRLGGLSVAAVTFP